MKVFVTGSSGYIGRNLVDRLSGKHDIIEYDLAEGQDILNYKNLREAMEGCDVVVHLAAIRGPYEDKEFSDYFEVNCRGTLNVVRAAVENNIRRFVYTSSTSYYGAERGIPYAKPVKESNPVITQNAKAEDLNCKDCDIAYSTSKVITEQILANYGLTKKVKVVILRLGPIGGGPEEDWSVNGIGLKMKNALQAIESAVELERDFWYEAFTITDASEDVDLSKARELLDYRPD